MPVTAGADTTTVAATSTTEAVVVVEQTEGSQRSTPEPKEPEPEDQNLGTGMVEAVTENSGESGEVMAEPEPTEAVAVEAEEGSAALVEVTTAVLEDIPTGVRVEAASSLHETEVGLKSMIDCTSKI